MTTPGNSDTSHRLSSALAAMGVADVDRATLLVRGIRGALDADGTGPTPVQIGIVDALTGRFVEGVVP